MSTVSEIVQDSKLRAMSAAGGDTGDGMDDLLNWNNLTYKMPVTNSVVSARNIKTYPADRATYSWGPGGTGRAGPMFFHLQAGEQYIDWGKSYLRFTLQHTPQCANQGILTFGLGSACNFIETVIVTTRSGTEIHRCEQFNRWRAMQDRLTKPQHWFKQVGTMMGYTGDADFNKVLMCDTVARSDKSISDFCFEEIATAGFARSELGLQTFEYLIPLDALGGPFATGQLSPAVLAGGLIIELRLAPYLQVFTGFDFNKPRNIDQSSTTANLVDNTIATYVADANGDHSPDPATGLQWISYDMKTSSVDAMVREPSYFGQDIKTGRDKTVLTFRIGDGSTSNTFKSQCCSANRAGEPTVADLGLIQPLDELDIGTGDENFRWLQKHLGVKQWTVLGYTDNKLLVQGKIGIGSLNQSYNFEQKEGFALTCGVTTKGFRMNLHKTAQNKPSDTVPKEYPEAVPTDDLQGVISKIENSRFNFPDFVGLSGYMEEIMLHDASTAPILTDISVHLDTHLLNDAAMRSLTQTSASDGLEIVYEEAFHQQSGVQTTQMDIVCSKAVSRALRVFGGLYEPPSNGLWTDLTRPIGLPDQYFWRLGSIFFPNTPVSSQLVAYHNLLYALEQVDDKKYSSDISPVTFKQVFPIVCATFERSALLKYSGSAINNSRTLTISARLPQELVDAYASTGMQFHFWLEHLAVAKTFLNNCIVSI